jgi:hypothetical protein
MLIQKVGKNSDSVGCARDAMNAFGNRMKRVPIAAQKMRKSTMSSMNTISPNAVRPLNRCGVRASTTAIPPVLIVVVNHAHVK